MSNADPTKTTSEDAVDQSKSVDYGGMDANLDKVDLERADEVASDPPGGLGTDIGGGNREIGQREQRRKMSQDRSGQCAARGLWA